MPQVVDQMGRSVDVPAHPQRIISLVPSQTELLVDLTLEHRLVGRTHFCIHPKPKLKSVTPVGGTKKVRFNKIDSLQPDLIIGNKEENTQNDIEALCERYPVWMSDIKTIQDAFEMMLMIGNLTQTESIAQSLTHRLKRDFEKIKLEVTPVFEGKTVAYMIWNHPMMVAATKTFIHEVLTLCGFKNAFNHLTRYPEINLDELAEINPDFVFLSSEPFPFKEKHIASFRDACPNSIISLVNGEVFSWYGSRLLYCYPYLSKLTEELKSLK